MSVHLQRIVVIHGGFLLILTSYIQTYMHTYVLHCNLRTLEVSDTSPEVLSSPSSSSTTSTTTTAAPTTTATVNLLHLLYVCSTMLCTYIATC